jgi:FkbM family methyltransferase
MASARWIATKARDLVVLEGQLARASELSKGSRVRLAIDRYAALARDARELSYLGKAFCYDGRLMPALLPSYLEEIRVLNEIVPLANASVVDVGANIGQFAATIARRFPESRIWSFEPNPTIMPLLERNAALSPRWSVAPWGVAEQDSEIQLWAVEGKSGQGSVIRENALAGLNAGDAIAHPVQLKRLTTERLTALDIPSTVDVVKVDVEGAEGAALAGLAELDWRFLKIEASLNRAGGLSVKQICDVVASLWHRQPTLAWEDTPRKNAATQDVILAR